MRTLFSEQTQPFFAQADLVEVEPLVGDVMLGDWLRRRFAI